MKLISQPIPTNIITGFLGAGKTTAILSLLRQKPESERWAILVNEFGEIGIDAGLIAGEAGNGQQVFLREVPGGCMCCAAGLPMQVALNQLITRARPDRLLIEPTGLGHPREVINALLQPEYRATIALQTIVTLVDARKIADARYTGHSTFRQQLEVADCIVANKRDLYGGDDIAVLKTFLQTLNLGDTPLHVVSQGRLQPEWLETTRHYADVAPSSSSGKALRMESIHADASPVPQIGFLRKSHEDDGFFSIGWKFRREWLFDHDKLYLLLGGLDAERIKAVMRTSNGVIGFNRADGVLSSIPLEDAPDSRIEIIMDSQPEADALEKMLLESVVETRSKQEQSGIDRQSF